MASFFNCNWFDKGTTIKMVKQVLVKIILESDFQAKLTL